MSAATLLEKAREDTRRKVQETAHLERIVGLLPDLPYKFIHPSGYRAEGSVGFEMTSLHEVLPLVQALPAVNLVKYCDSCTTFMPACRLTDRDLLHKKSIDDAFGVILEAESLGYPGKLNVKWWVALAGNLLVQCKANVKETDSLVGWHAVWAYRQGEKYVKSEAFRHEWEEPPARLVSWASGAAAYLRNRTLWWERRSVSLEEVLRLHG